MLSVLLQSLNPAYKALFKVGYLPKESFISLAGVRYLASEFILAYSRSLFCLRLELNQ